jgi:hypothetical protein
MIFSFSVATFSFASEKLRFRKALPGSPQDPRVAMPPLPCKVSSLESVKYEYSLSTDLSLMYVKERQWYPPTGGFID